MWEFSLLPAVDEEFVDFHPFFEISGEMPSIHAVFPFFTCSSVQRLLQCWCLI